MCTTIFPQEEEEEEEEGGNADGRVQPMEEERGPPPVEEKVRGWGWILFRVLPMSRDIGDCTQMADEGLKRARAATVVAPSGYDVSTSFIKPSATGSAKIMVKRSTAEGGWSAGTIHSKGAAHDEYKVVYDEGLRYFHVVTLTEANYSAAEDAADSSWASLAKQGGRRRR